MKKKSLLLLIPFAAAALSGCTPILKPCEQASITFKATSMVLIVGDTKQIEYTIPSPGNRCIGTLTFESDDESIATVDSSGKVTGVSEGTAVITCNGVEITIFVDAEEPDPEHEVVSVIGVKSHPSTVKVGEKVNPNNVILDVEFADGTQGTAKATKVEVDTSEVAQGVTATAYYREVDSAEFTIDVIDEGQTQHEGTAEDPFDSADAASVAESLDENEVTEKSYYIKGNVEKFSEDFDSKYGNYSFEIGDSFICWRLKNGPESKNFNEGDIEIGDEVVVYAQIQKFHQDAAGDKPERTLLETKGGYVVSVKKEGQAEPVSIKGVKSCPTEIQQGKTLKTSDITIEVELSDGTTKDVNPTKVECDTSTVADSVDVVIHYLSLSPFTHHIKVTPKPEPTGQGAVYTFKNDQTSSQNWSQIGEEGFLKATICEGNEIITGYKDGTNAYIGGNGGSGDTAWTLLDCLKVGKSSAMGSITIDLDSTAEFDSIKMDVIGVRDDGELTVNGITKAVTKKASKTDLETMELEYDISGGTSSLVINSKNTTSGNFGICITRIEFVSDTPIDPTVLTEIEVSSEHRSFNLGDDFVKETVTAKYNKGNPVDVTNKAVFTGYDMNQAGEQTVTVSYTEAGVTKTTTYQITVLNQPAPHVDVESVSLDKTSLTLTEGATETLVATVSPSNATEKAVTWSTDNADVATVSNGVVTAVSEGTATITVTTVDGGFTAECGVTVQPKVGPQHEGTLEDPFTVDDAKIIYDGLEETEIDGPYYITGVIASNPAPTISSGRGQFYLEGTEENLYVYNANNVGGSNNLTADDIPVGSTVVVVGGIKKFVKDGVSMFELCYNKENPAIACELINVVKPEIHVTGVSFAQTEVTIGVTGNTTLVPVVAPSNATNKTCTFEIVSGADKVSLDGAKVTGVVEGDAVVKATTVDGGFEATITIHVTGDSPVIDPYEVSIKKDTGASSYAGTSTQKLENISWVLNGNCSIDNYVKLSAGAIPSGETSVTADRYICSQTAFSNPVTAVSFITGAIDSAAVINSATLTVYNTADDAKNGNNSVDSVTASWAANSEVKFSKPSSSDWSGKYFRLTLNITNTSKNKGVIVNGMKVYF